MQDLHDNTRRPERAVVAGIIERGREPEDAFAEIFELLRTAGVDVVGHIDQRRDNPHPRAYLGSGRLADLAALVKETDPDVVIIDDDISPSQQRNIEDALKRRVLDRTAVILDIFALHATTHEGKLQVELAQLQYNLSRMRGMWKHLERLGSAAGSGGPGVGTRGPGESQLETDRRLANRRIALLKKRLKDVHKHRENQRKQRMNSPVPRCALAGYTNAGKSTLLNRLTDADVLSEDMLFATLDPTTRHWEHNGRRYLMTDTVGFIERLPHQLVDAFKTTLDETLLADLILHIVAADNDSEIIARHMEAVTDVLSEIGADASQIVVFNKIDLIDDQQLAELKRRHPDAEFVSSVAGDGIDALTRRIEHVFADRFVTTHLLVPYTDAGMIAELYELGAPVTREDTAEGIKATAYLPRYLLGKVKDYVVEK